MQPVVGDNANNRQPGMPWCGATMCQLLGQHMQSIFTILNEATAMQRPWAHSMAVDDQGNIIERDREIRPAAGRVEDLGGAFVLPVSV